MTKQDLKFLGNGRGGVNDVTEDYRPFLKEIAQLLSVPISTIWVESHPTIGEECIYSNNRWMGYISEYLS